MRLVVAPGQSLGGIGPADRVPVARTGTLALCAMDGQGAGRRAANPAVGRVRGGCRVLLIADDKERRI